VADLVAQTLAAHGVRSAYGMPGGEVVALVDALGEAGIRFVLMRHETPAAIAAAGSSLFTPGAPGVLVTTLGPGLANAVNGIADAAQERMPLLVLSGVVDRPIRARYTHQVLDQAGLLRGLVKGSFEIEPAGAGETVARAVRLALTPPLGPVHLDLAPAVAPAAAPAGSRPGGPVRRATPAADRADSTLAGLREALARASRPLVIAGFEAARAGAAEGLTALADDGIPVLTTYKAKGVVDEAHPCALGGAGLSPKADAVLLAIARAADFVVLPGYDPIEMRPGWLDPFAPDAEVVELSAGPVDHGMHRADRQIVGHLPSLLAALAPGRSPRPFWPGGDIEAARAELRCLFAPPEGVSWGPHQVVDILQETLPPDALVTVDSGAHRILLSQRWRAREPFGLLQSAGWCTMGAALPLAIGAVSHARARPVIAVMGDGGLEMVLGELGTLRDEALPVIAIVMQDESLALIELKQRQAGLTAAGVRLGHTDLAAVAAAFGGAGVTVADPDALRTALRDALRRRDRFTLIACTIRADLYVDHI
jgi:acetolactate synthase-1/2/3 large subunit